MARITDPVAARRFARAIVADILLYNGDAIENATPGVGKAVEEGRRLFAERVEPQLLPAFETAVAESRLAPWGAVIGGPAPIERARAERPPLMTTETEAPSKLPFFVLLLVLLVGALVFALLRR